MSAPSKMNPEIKAQWLAALRSGKYKQGFGYLKALDGNVATYCCLGVLCELAVKAGIIPEANRRVDPSPQDDSKYFLYGNDYTYPGESVQAWAGLTEADPKIQLPEGTVTLSFLNDESGSENGPLFGRYTFQQIADLIEEQL